MLLSAIYAVPDWWMGNTHVVEYTYMPTDFITGITEDVVKSSILFLFGK